MNPEGCPNGSRVRPTDDRPDAPGSSTCTVFVNGKFTAQRTTGVQRVARQALDALDRLLARSMAPGRSWVLLCPQGSIVPTYRRIEVRAIGVPRMPLHVWEQCVLPWSARSGRLLSLAGSAPYLPSGQVCTFHDAAVFDHPEAYTPPFVHWYRALFRRQARVAALLLTVSAFSQSRLAQRLAFPPGRFNVVPNGGDHLDGIAADDTVLDRHELRGRRFVLAVASANPTKNIERLTQAFSRFADDPELALVLVGGRNGAVFADGKRAVDDRRIVQTGPLADAPLVSLYRHAVGLVFPSVYEGFGLPPLEAMSCGCPVAAARAAAIPEVCGEAVLYFDPWSVDAIEAALRRLVGDAELRLRLAAAGRVRAQAWRWDATAVALAAAVEGVI